MWDVIGKRDRRLIAAFDSWDDAYNYARSNPAWKVSPTEYRQSMGLELTCSSIDPSFRPYRRKDNLREMQRLERERERQVEAEWRSELATRS